MRGCRPCCRLPRRTGIPRQRRRRCRRRPRPARLGRLRPGGAGCDDAGRIRASPSPMAREVSEGNDVAGADADRPGGPATARRLRTRRRRLPGQALRARASCCCASEAILRRVRRRRSCPGRAAVAWAHALFDAERSELRAGKARCGSPGPRWRCCMPLARRRGEAVTPGGIATALGTPEAGERRDRRAGHPASAEDRRSARRRASCRPCAHRRASCARPLTHAGTRDGRAAALPAAPLFAGSAADHHPAPTPGAAGVAARLLFYGAHLDIDFAPAAGGVAGDVALSPEMLRGGPGEPT